MDRPQRVHHRPEPRLRRPAVPISRQAMPERPVRIGAGSWLGHGTVVLPGATIGRHVVIGANSVVRGEIPANCVAAGNPAQVVKEIAQLDRQLAGLRTWSRNRRRTVQTALRLRRRRQLARSWGGAQLGISLSPANCSSFSLIGIPSTAASVNGSFSPARSRSVNSAAVGEIGAVVRLPLRHDRPALVVGRRDGDHVVEHRLHDVRRLGRRCRRARRASPGRRDRRPARRRASARSAWADSQIDSARAAQSRSPILLTASLEAKNSAHTQNAASPATATMMTVRHNLTRFAEA